MVAGNMDLMNKGRHMHYKKSNISYVQKFLFFLILLFASSTAAASQNNLPIKDIKMVPQLGHSLSVQNMVFMRSKPAFISGAKDGKIKIWSSDYRLIRTIAVGNHRNVALHPDESMIAVSKLGGSAELWSLNGKLIKRLPRMTTPIIDQLAFSPAGQENSRIQGGPTP